MSPRHIFVAKDFSKFPAGRYRTDGPFSGAQFRDDFLVPALKGADPVVVELDGTLGYGSSFLEEAFGGLVRCCGFKAADLRKKLTIRSATDRSLAIEVWSYIDDAKPTVRTS